MRTGGEPSPMTLPPSARVDVLRALAAIDAGDKDAALRHLLLAFDALTGGRTAESLRTTMYRGSLTTAPDA